MASWAEFAAAEPEMAAAGRKFLFQYGPGLAFLATVSRDGAPRVHPITVALTDEQLYAFIVPGPKQHDLERDGRYALHAFLPDKIDDEFMVAGRAVLCPTLTDRLAAFGGYHESKVPDEWPLYRFDIERAMLATYDHRGQWPPTYRRWRAPGVDSQA